MTNGEHFVALLTQGEADGDKTEQHVFLVDATEQDLKAVAAVPAPAPAPASKPSRQPRRSATAATSNSRVGPLTLLDAQHAEALFHVP